MNDKLFSLYRIQIPSFEGPFDLLLYLIKKNEINIWDIPIAKITEEYLEYISAIKDLDLDLAGDFLLIASTLLSIKSKMLLPRAIENENEIEEDPRTSLVKRLLEYQVYKEASINLSSRNILGKDVFIRNMPAFDFKIEENTEYLNLSVFELVSVLESVFERADIKGHVHQITAERFSVVDSVNWIYDQINNYTNISIENLFNLCSSKLEIVLTFLALLEMLKMNLVNIEKINLENNETNIYSYRLQRTQEQ